jgi:hypothetical protein
MATVVPLLLLLVAMVRALPSAPPVALPLPAASAATAAALPEAFGARSLVFGCADTILDQGLCGSCSPKRCVAPPPDGPRDGPYQPR